MLNAILESFNVNFFRKSIPRAITRERERERERGGKINTEKIMMERR
jgi:hypothetical protein